MKHFVLDVFYNFGVYNITLNLREITFIKNDHKFYVDDDTKTISSYQATPYHTAPVFRSLSTNA